MIGQDEESEVEMKSFGGGGGGNYTHVFMQH